MNGKKYIVKTTEKSQKAEAGLSHPKNSILVMMKGKKYIMKSTGVIQKAEVGLSQQHMSDIEVNIKSVMNNLYGLATIQHGHPHVINFEYLHNKVTNLEEGPVYLSDIEVQMGHMVDSPVKYNKL